MCCRFPLERIRRLERRQTRCRRFLLGWIRNLKRMQMAC